MTQVLKDAAKQRLESVYGEMLELSHRIHANPELRFKEEKASAWVADLLESHGFAVERGVCEMPTALIARAGNGPLHVAICAEYDCLPAIGHACGHNIIAAAAVGAGIAAAAVADDGGLTVSVFGTPAEEGGGGKILMLNHGAFENEHAAMMVHPAPFDALQPMMIAVQQLEVTYTGKEAHASASPQQGVNAADALTVAQVAIGLTRQHLRSTDRVHGITTKGGDAVNVIPAHTSARYAVRARTLDHLGDVRAKIQRCFEAGALATGSELTVTEGEPYAQMVHDADISAAYLANASALGRVFPDLGSGDRSAASTDMGNVSLAVPSIHPTIGINSLPAVNHQPEFAEHCASAVADQAVYDGALAMAWTAIDIAQDDAVRDRLLSPS